MKSVLDPAFRYVPSNDTDLRKTFSRVRRDLEIAKAQAHVARGAVGGPLVTLDGTKRFAGQRR